FVQCGLPVRSFFPGVIDFLVTGLAGLRSHIFGDIAGGVVEGLPLVSTADCVWAEAKATTMKRKRIGNERTREVMEFAGMRISVPSLDKVRREGAIKEFRRS
ncbi:MAG: hypothetical protein WAO04_02370, partial [Candidatus Sulfotelmatobacter sp.]